MSGGLISSLQNSAKALGAYSRAAQVAGNNIANVNTEGYARQIVSTGPKSYYSTGGGVQNTGVEVLSIDHVRDSVLDAQILRETRAVGTLESQQNMLRLFENTLGESIGRETSLATLDGGAEDNLKQTGLLRNFQDFLGSWNELSSTPELLSTKGALYQRAEVLVTQFHSLDNSFKNLTDEITIRIDSEVDQAERIIDEIGQLNESISRSEVRESGSAIELRSQRQLLLERLAKFVDFKTEENQSKAGMLNLVMTSQDENDILLLSGNQRITDITYDGTDLRAGNPPVAIKMSGGTVYGYSKVQHEDLIQLQESIDVAAEQIVRSVNAAYNPGGVVGEDFFDPNGTTAGTIEIRSGLTPADVRAADVGVTTGGNEIAKAVSDLSEAVFNVNSGDYISGTITSHLLNINTSLGGRIDTVRYQHEAQENINEYLSTQRDSLSGVNIDEEVTNMMKFQRAYQATSRVIHMVDEMLEILVRDLV